MGKSLVEKYGLDVRPNIYSSNSLKEVCLIVRKGIVVPSSTLISEKLVRKLFVSIRKVCDKEIKALGGK